MRYRLPRVWSLLVCAAFAASTAACGLLGGPADPSSATPPEYVPAGGQTKCKITASQLRPLIVEWSAADRAALEVLAQRGTVVVKYSGCEMEILPRCRAPGAYAYASTTRKTEQVVIQDEDELYANLPMGAVKLEGKLKRSGQLNVAMNVVGQYDSDQPAIAASALEGDCAKATHVVTGLTVGAFEFSAGASASAGGEASALGAGAGGLASRSRETLSSDGDVAACASSTREDAQPPANCGALLRIAMAELAEPTPQPASVGALSCPPGTRVAGDQCVAVPSAASLPTRMHVRVGCGLLMNAAPLGLSDGLKVWVDGEPVEAAEEMRVFNPLAPGAPGILQFVAYDTTPGEHRVRIEADGCAGGEHVVKLKPGEPKDVQGRLRPNKWYSRAPAASAGIGIAANYHVFKFDSIKLEDDNYDEVSVEPDTMQGFGVEIPIALVNYWVSFGFSYTKGDLPIEAPACGSSTDCLPGGTKVTGSVSGYHVPIRFGGRLPFVYGAALLGTGLEFNILKADTAEAEPNFGFTHSGLGFHLPIWAGVEVRPTCGLALVARAAHGFGFGDVGSYNEANVSLAVFSAVGCSDSDFGFQ